MKSPQTKPANELIAIIGMGCRLPGARTLGELWRLLLDGEDTVGRYPGNRFPEADAFLLAAADDPRTAAMPLGGFLENIDEFDASAFEISPREAMYLDPQHRLLLEVAWAALEDAGQVRQDPQTRRTGVFTGLWSSDFENTLYKTGADLDFYAMTGSGRAGASGRLSFTFGFEGPSLTIDAACSSSLVAVHLACQSLVAGECDMALAGGANAILATEATQMFTQAGMLAADGRCKFGDAAADGFVRSEGAGMVVLKRLHDAIAAGDPIHAVVRGSAVSNDGRSSGTLMTPSREGQRQTLHEAWNAAGVSGSQIRFFEAHGTGTSVGDPVEVGAIADALRDDGATATCWIGSIKSNIGHTESAAGIASLIKVVLALKNRLVPKTLLGGLPNSAIDWAGTGLQLVTEHQDLTREPDPLLAGVSSFGLMGTNSHVVVEEYRKEQTRADSVPEAKTYLLPVSARSANALDALLKEYESFASEAALRDLCYTASVRRRHDEYRAAFVCESLEDLHSAVSTARREGLFSGEDAIARKVGKRRVVFIAPGQGSQWAGMARGLFAEQPVFRQRMEECAAAIFVETGWSLIDVLLGATTEQALQEIDIVQPALFAISISLAALWRSWGIAPDAVVGHSMGEVAAACIAGALTLADAAAVICRRSRLMKSIRGSGAMLTIELPVPAVQRLLIDAGGDVAVGASNSPDATVISGSADAIDQVETILLERQIFCRRIRVDVASHSSQVDPILRELRESLSTIEPNRCELNLLSTVTGEYLAGIEMDADYWVSNLRQTVNYATAIETLANDGYDVFIELSPHPILAAATEDTLRAAGKNFAAVACGRRGQPEMREILEALASLYRYGCEIDWKSIYADPGRCVPLPEYQFQRERCWPDLEELEAERPNRQRLLATDHPLLGRRFESSLQPNTILWELDLNLKTKSYLSDHQVHGTIVLPAAAQIEAVLEAMRVEAPGTAFDLCDVRFDSAIQITEAAQREYQLGLRRRSSGAYQFEIFSRARGAEEEWTLHSYGFAESKPKQASPAEFNPLLGKDQNWKRVDGVRHYRLRTRAGIGYGPSFRLLQEVWYRPGESVSRIAQTKEQSTRGSYTLHPAVLDSCFQAMQYAEPEGHGFLFDDTCLPVSLGRVHIYADLPPSGEIVCHTRLVHADSMNGITRYDLSLADPQGKVGVTVKGLELQRVSASMEERAAELLFVPAWLPFELSFAPEQASSVGKLVLIFCDAQGVGETLADRLAAAGGRAILVRPAISSAKTSEYTIDPARPDSVVRLFAQLDTRGEVVDDVVHLWSLDHPRFNDREIEPLLASQALGSYFVPSLVQAISACNWRESPRLWLVTSGAMSVREDDRTPQLAAAPMWGLGSVIAVEHPELRASMVDLSDRARQDEIDSLLHLLQAGPDEDRIALRDEEMFVARFVRSTAEVDREHPRSLRQSEEYGITLSSPGVLDNLVLQAFERTSPAAGEVAIEVAAAGLNFIDVTKALGVYPGLDPNAPISIGAECAGIVRAVGEGVTAFKVGDEVLALSNSPSTTGLFASRVCLPDSAVFQKPAALTLEQAAGFPIAFLTAYYSLVELARIRPGEWIFVPAGAGGVGLAAIQIAQSLGAQVIASASTPEKQQYLRSIDVEHVLPSRTLAFAEEVLAISGGHGVDVVLNSLAGEYISKSLEVLKPFGRFMELGKRDIYLDKQIGLKVFRHNISYHAVDLAAMMEQRPEYVSGLMQVLMERVETGELRPLPTKTFSASEPGSPFHFMAQGKHVGKIVVRMDRDVSVLPSAKKSLFRKDATYLVTGGMGGVGSTVAEWMAENGAGCLVLLSRREEGPETRALMSRIKARGARVGHARTNLVDRDALEALLDTIRAELPPIAGIMHAATVIDDALVADLSPERFPFVMGPKVQGTWNLYAATAEDKLDFMVLFSSIAAVYAQPGHGSYAAANAFLDSFARYARSNGRNVSSINWGGWDGIGLTREAGTARSVSGYGQQGFRAMAGPLALSALKRVLEADLVQAIATPLDLEEAAEFYGSQRTPPVLRTLLSELEGPGRQTAELPAVQTKLAVAASYAESLRILRDYLSEELSRVLKLPPERIGKDTLFGSIGLDSLMTLEFVRRIKTGLGVAVPTTSVYNHPTADLLAADLANRLQLSPESAELPASQPERTRMRDMATTLVSNEVSDDEAMIALMQPVGK